MVEMSWVSFMLMWIAVALVGVAIGAAGGWAIGSQRKAPPSPVEEDIDIHSLGRNGIRKPTGPPARPPARL